ncbi:restriction endonuclease subunit S [Xanthomarina gelatinilytica]|uniref:restriction endonuclease subunit S n=1 Tax=Xanthomarina gelatinilytica TaxID=1137281 RepID=UPI003AA90D36
MDKRESKIPLVRFPEFKEGWEHKQLNELLKVSKKKNTDLKYSKEEVLSVSGELGIVNQIEHLGRSYAGESVHNYGVVENGDIVYTKSPLKENPYGIIKLNKGVPGIVSTLYAVYKVKDNNADGEFIEHYFSLDANTNRYLRPLVRKGAKNDMKINNEYVLHDRIFVPKKEEQKRIAHCFNVIDTKINQLKEKHSLLEEYKKGVMQRIFTQEIRFKKEDGSDFPDWSKKELGDLLDYIQPTKYLVRSTDYSELYKTPVITAGKTFILGYTDEADGIFKCVNPIIAFDDFTTASQFVDFDFKVKSSAMKILKAKGGMNIRFIYEAMKQIRFPVGGHQRHWISIYSQIPIKLPNIKEQNKIAELIKSIDNKIAIVLKETEDLKAYKKGLLQQMFVY